MGADVAGGIPDAYTVTMIYLIHDIRLERAICFLCAENEYEAISKQATVRYSFRNGKIIAETKPSEATISLDQGTEKINFNK